MEGMSVEDVHRYLLEHTDLATRFPNWSSSVNLSHFLHVLSRDVSDDQGQLTAEQEADVERLHEVSRQFKRCYLWVIVALGLPGNLASLFTFLHMRSLGSCVVYVAVLAVVDSLALVEKLLLSLLQEHEVPFSPTSCKALLFLANGLVIYANWIIVALAAERLFAVCRPLALTAYWTRSRAAAGLVALLLLSLVACAPVLVLSEPTHDARSCMNAVGRRSMARVWHWVNVTLYGFLPCLSLLAINVAIVSLLRRARRKHRQLCHGAAGSRSRSGARPRSYAGRGARAGPGAGSGRGPVKQRELGDSQRQASVMLLVASFVLIVLTTPRCALLLMQQLWRPRDLLLVARMRVFNQVTFALSDLNHAINFYLYFVSARHFRRRFLDLLRCSQHGRLIARLSSRDTVQRRISDSVSVRFLATTGNRMDSVRNDGRGVEGNKPEGPLRQEKVVIQTRPRMDLS